MGIDIGIKRDTTAITSVFPWPEMNEGRSTYAMWSCAIFQPPVNMITQVHPYLEKLLQHRIEAIGFDPYMMATTQQWLIEEGYGHLLVEVNQQTEMTLAANTLHSHAWEGTFLIPKDGELRSHFTACAAEHKERGWRIIKQKQSKPIDGVVSTAMALMMATKERGHIWHPTARDNPNLSAAMLP